MRRSKKAKGVHYPRANRKLRGKIVEAVVLREGKRRSILRYKKGIPLRAYIARFKTGRKGWNKDPFAFLPVSDPLKKKFGAQRNRQTARRLRQVAVQ